MVLAQGLAASWLLWLVQRSVREAPGAALHLLLCAGLAALTAAPWFLASVMPDALTALAPLCLFLLGFGRLSRGEMLAPWLLWRAWRARDMPRAALILVTLMALAGNAFATGALSKPLHRYEARIIWLLPAAVVLALLPAKLRRR